MVVLLALSFFLSAQASAHVTNEETVYRDISDSEAAADILLLDLLGVISAEGGSQEFRPKDFLTAAEFKEWMVRSPFEEIPLPTGDETMNFGLVNAVLFGASLDLEQPEQAMTREQFARFVASHARDVIEGESLFTRAGFKKGPDGRISEVEQLDHGYLLHMEGEPYPLGIHPRIQGDSVDPAVWEGMVISESWLGEDLTDGQAGQEEKQQTEAIQYAVIETGDAGSKEPAEAIKEDTKSAALAKPELDAEAGKVNWVTVLAVCCVALLVYWINKKKKHKME